MNDKELQDRVKKAEKEGLVVERTGSGYMVTSSTKKGGYLVTDDNGLACACADYYMHKSDITWKCKHILAVEALLTQAPTTGSRFAALECWGDK